jgi:hypothetical protein
MKTLFVAAFTALSVASISPAIAGEGEATIANTQFTLMQVPIASASPITVAPDRGSADTYFARSISAVSLFPPHASNDGGGHDN